MVILLGFGIFRIPAIIFLVVFCSLCLPWPVHADDIDDAIQIIDARQGTVRKWSHTPSFLIVHDRKVKRAAIEETIAFMNSATGLGIEPAEYLDLTGIELGERFYRGTSYRPKRQENGLGEVTLTIAAERDFVGKGNLVVFMMQVPYAAHLMVASGYGNGSQSLERQYFRGPEYCFFDIRSDNESIALGRIFISSELDPVTQASCIYEEFTQVLGLVADAKGSEVFTYDNEATDKPRDYDRRLIEALYHPSVVHGDPVAKVIALYARSAPQ